MQTFIFEVTVVTDTLEQAVEVLEKRLAPAKDLGDPNDPAAMPFGYIIGRPFKEVREP
jgi:hypothetical protein